ncbi:hypothetical protein ACTHQT_13570 [Cytobacillus praedii]
MVKKYFSLTEGFSSISISIIERDSAARITLFFYVKGQIME